MDWTVEGWWLLVNVAVAALGPWFANLVLYWVELVGDSAAKLNPWGAYRDGQMGFVAVGWSAATLYDIATHVKLYPKPGLMQLALIVSIVGGALFAAAGGRKPITTSYTPAPAGTGLFQRLILWADFHKAAAFSLLFSLVSLTLMLVVHFTIVLSETHP